MAWLRLLAGLRLTGSVLLRLRVGLTRLCLLRGHIWLLCELARLLRRLLLTSRCKLRRLLPKLSRLLGRLRLPELWRLRPGLLLGRLRLPELWRRPGLLLGRLARCPRLILLGRGSVLRRLRPEMRRRRVHRGSRLRRLQIVMRLSRRRLVRRLIVLRRALLLLALFRRTLLGLAFGLLAGRA